MKLQTILERASARLVSGKTGALALATLTLAAGSGLWASHVGGTPSLAAAVNGANSADSDGDGLVNVLESTLGTWSCHADTDGDGFSDLEEVARKSNPLNIHDFPTLSEPSVAMAAFQLGGQVHVATLVYAPDGNLHTKRLRFGARVGDHVLGVPLAAMRGGAPIQVRSGHAAGSRIAVLDPVVHSNTVLARRGMSLFATLAQQGAYLDADACNLASIQGALYQMISIPGPVPNSPPQNGPGIGLGNAYRPIDPTNQNPSNITGEICAQTTTVVRVVGAVVTQEVIAADCVPGWDTFCSPGCVNTVGNTIRSIDPAALIGG